MKVTEFFERVLGLRELWSVKDIPMDMKAFGHDAVGDAAESEAQKLLKFWQQPDAKQALGYFG